MARLYGWRWSQSLVPAAFRACSLLSATRTAGVGCTPSVPIRMISGISTIVLSSVSVRYLPSPRYLYLVSCSLFSELCPSFISRPLWAGDFVIIILVLGEYVGDQGFLLPNPVFI